MSRALLLLLVLPLTGCSIVAGFGVLASGQHPLVLADQARYSPKDDQRAAVWTACLQDTNGQGREPFDACMAAKGYTR